MGLRERKKLETRMALSWAAVRLAVERGLENVLVEDIAAAAGVSPRTFNNYFASKAEAISSRHVDRVRLVTLAFRERPPGEPLWDAITEAVLSQFGGDQPVPDPDWTAGVRLMTSEPGLQGELMKAGAIAEQEFAVAVAERTGGNADVDLHPKLVAAAIGSAIEVATQQWLTADPPVALGPLVRDALGQIAAGLPTP